MSEKILIVDDDVDSLKLIGLMLQRNGYEVIAANAGQQGLTRALNDLPDLIILDVMMPDMNGYEVCRRLRANPKTEKIPIIMFTAKTLIDDKVAGFEAGADDYLTKPTHPTELTSRVQAILKRNGKSKEDPTPEGEAGLRIGVVGVKGGVGTTTVALNLAMACQQKGTNPVVADFRPGAGHMGLYLGLNSAAGMENVLRGRPSEINASIVDRNLTVHNSNLRALLSSTDPQQSLISFDLQSAAAVVNSLSELGNPSFIDLGAGYTPFVKHLHQQMDLVVLLVEPNMILMPQAQALLRELEGTNKARVALVVVNRNQHNLQPPWHEVERALDQDIRGIIASDAQTIYEANQAGMPVVAYKPNTAIAGQLNKLTDVILN